MEERSLSSILRSSLLTTLINNDVSGKANASALLGRDAGESERDADTRSMNRGRGVNNVDTEPPGFGDASICIRKDARALGETEHRVTGGHVADSVFERAQAHFNEQELIALGLP